MYTLDETDKKLLVLLQEGIPICPSPYRRLAEQLGDVTEEEVIRRIGVLREEKVIRRFSGFFNSGKLGYVSALCAVTVREENITSAASFLDSIPGVTHNYLRDHEFNMWFTLICSSREKMDETIRGIEESGLTEGKIQVLEGTRQFKVRTMFDVREGKDVRDA